MTAAAMSSRKSRQWGDCDDDDDNDEVVEVDDNNEMTTTSASPPPATTDPSPPRRIHPPRPSPVSPVGWGDVWRRRRRRLGQCGGAAQVEAGRRQRLDVGNANAPPRRIHPPPRPSPVSPVGWGDASRRRRQRLGRRGGAAQVEAGCR